jgi:ABC-2 type transport system ATP-binding protein
MTSILEFTSVNKNFKQRKRTIQALRDISFNVKEGEVFGFVGPNGAGKSTTIKIMLDVIRDYSGEVRIHGVNARKPEARNGVCYLPETPALYEQFTPLEILQMTLRMYGIKRKDNNNWCMHWLDRFSVAQYADRRIRQLSKGNVQRTALASAMVASPKLLVLDEPLSGLDPVGRKDVIDILIEYKADGGAIFFTSHVLHDVERVADRFGLINEGQLITTRKPSELVGNDAARFIIRYYSNSSDITVGRPLRDTEYEYELGQNELPAFIEQVNRMSGQVISIKPAISLESMFFKIIKESTHNNKATP